MNKKNREKRIMHENCGNMYTELDGWMNLGLRKGMVSLLNE